jgi:hypothetical protein
MLTLEAPVCPHFALLTGASGICFATTLSQSCCGIYKNMAQALSRRRTLISPGLQTPVQSNTIVSVSSQREPRSLLIGTDHSTPRSGFTNAVQRPDSSRTARCSGEVSAACLDILVNTFCVSPEKVGPCISLVGGGVSFCGALRRKKPHEVTKFRISVLRSWRIGVLVTEATGNG